MSRVNKWLRCVDLLMILCFRADLCRVVHINVLIVFVFFAGCFLFPFVVIVLKCAKFYVGFVVYLFTYEMSYLRSVPVYF